MLKFAIDESSGRKLAISLKVNGYNAIYAGDSLRGMADEQVLQECEKDERILITNDMDFGELIFRQRKSHKGVILLRLRVDNPANRLKAILLVIDNVGMKLENKFVIVSEDKIRIR